MVGNPLRRDLFSVDRQRARRQLGLPGGRRSSSSSSRLLVVQGGSLGCGRLNAAFAACLPQLMQAHPGAYFLHPQAADQSIWALV